MAAIKKTRHHLGISKGSLKSSLLTALIAALQVKTGSAAQTATLGRGGLSGHRQGNADGCSHSARFGVNPTQAPPRPDGPAVDRRCWVPGLGERCRFMFLQSYTKPSAVPLYTTAAETITQSRGGTSVSGKHRWPTSQTSSLSFTEMRCQAAGGAELPLYLFTVNWMRWLCSKIFISVLVSYSQGFFRPTPSGRPWATTQPGSFWIRS